MTRSPATLTRIIRFIDRKGALLRALAAAVDAHKAGDTSAFAHLDTVADIEFQINQMDRAIAALKS
jgi:hypothetical protein